MQGPTKRIAEISYRRKQEENEGKKRSVRRADVLTREERM